MGILLYIGIIVVTLVISGGASMLVKSQFNRAKKVAVSSGYTGAEIARRILQAQGVDDVSVVETQGFLSDHYNPMKRELALSPDVYHGRSAAAAGVAAHEVGHALQHARGSMSMWLRSILAPAAGLGSGLSPWLIMIGAFMGGFAQLQSSVYGGAAILTLIGIGFFALMTLFTIVTVPNEFDASARARTVLMDMGIITTQAEGNAVRGVLTAAGLTYVAAAVTSIMWLLYYLLPLILGGNDE